MNGRRAIPVAALALVLTGCGGEANGGAPEPQAGAGERGMILRAHARVLPGREWQRRVKAEPGDVVEYRLTLFNDGPGQARDVKLEADLPRGIEKVFGSERIKMLTVHVANAEPFPRAFTRRPVTLMPFSVRDNREVYVRGRVDRGATGRLPLRATLTSQGDRESARVVVERA